MQISHDLTGEPLVELLVGVEHQAFPLGPFLALGHQGGVLVALEQPRHLPVGEQRVHPLQEARVQDVRLVQDEGDLLVLAAGAPQHCAEVLIEILASVLIVNL